MAPSSSVCFSEGLIFKHVYVFLLSQLGINTAVIQTLLKLVHYIERYLRVHICGLVQR